MINPKRVIVNADDYGSNSSINRAIIALFDRGVVNSTTIMANMPGFLDAVELAHRYKIINRIGIHLVLTEGKPLTQRIGEISYLFNKKENLSRIRTRKLFFLGRKERSIIYQELAAQIEKVKKEGIRISHIDTHHQLHDSLSLLKIIIDLLKTYKISSVRILNNLERKNMIKNTYRDTINRYLKYRKLNYSDFLGDQIDFMSMFKKNPLLFNKRKVEIMVHPDFDVNGDVVDKVGKKEYGFEFLHIMNSYK